MRLRRRTVAVRSVTAEFLESAVRSVTAEFLEFFNLLIGKIYIKTPNRVVVIVSKLPISAY